MNEELANRIRQCRTLPTLPAIAIQVLEMAQRPDVDISEIARIISKDPALSSKILRTVNSSFYARSQNVATVSQALVILGLQSVKTLVLGFSLITTLSKDKPAGFKHLDYWRRSIYSATAARAIAAKISLVQQEETFLAALLKDIGMLILDQVAGEQYGQIHARAACHEDLAALEREALGADHAEVAGLVASQWKLPPVLTSPIANHHNPEAVTDAALKKIVELVHLAGRCADVFVEPLPAPAIAEARRMCGAYYQMSEQDCDALLADIGSRTKEAASLFEINISGAPSYEQILKRANETLVEITLQSQQQGGAGPARQQAAKSAGNAEALTSLTERERFDTFMAEHFASAMLSGKPLSIVLLNVDNLKAMFDRYGRAVGEKLLKALGQFLSGSARAQDLAARLGDEELYLVLPGAPKATAAAVAEKIRVAIAARPIPCGGHDIPVTASIGVATFDSDSPLHTPTHLLKAAGLALSAAKSAGNNCVRVFTMPQKIPVAAA